MVYCSDFLLGMPMAELEHRLTFIPPDEYPIILTTTTSIPVKPAFTITKKRNRSLTSIVHDIIFNSDRFYSPVNRYKREYTSTGTKIIYPHLSKSEEVFNKNKKKFVRPRSFLWDSNWVKSNNNSIRSYSDSSSSSIKNLDNLSNDFVFDEIAIHSPNKISEYGNPMFKKMDGF